MFWEKADHKDTDYFSAFRKRDIEQKMKTRNKTKLSIESYLKMFELRKSCLSVLYILQDTYKREELKNK